MKLSLGQAAKTAKVAKSTISKALKNGDISAEKDENGWYKIDPSELQRWMDAKQVSKRSQIDLETPTENTENTSGNSSLEAEVKALREQVEKSDIERQREREQLQAHIEDLRGRVERAERKEDQLQALLTDQRQQQTEPPKTRGLWARLTG